MLKKCQKSHVLPMKNVPVCTQSKRPRVHAIKTSPCARNHNVPVCTQSKRLRVCTATKTRTCVSTCARGAGTHGDVLNLHTEVFSACQAAPHTTPHNTQHNTTQHKTHTHTPHKPRTPTRNNTRRQRQRQTETEKEDRDRERREKIHFQCGGAWPFFVDVVIFWLIPFAHET